MRRRLKWIGLGLLTLAFVAAAFVAIASSRTKFPGEEITPAGFRQATAVYVKMHDAVEIAVTVWLPPDLKSGERAPVLMRTTRVLARAQTGLGPAHAGSPSSATF